MKPHSGGYTAAERAQALTEAEEHLVRPGPEDAKELLLRLDEITTHPVLFQPRAFLSARVGDREELDEHRVKMLQQRMRTTGELDPMTVVRLRVWTDPNPFTGKRDLSPVLWIIVDGHHRLAAYQELKWKAPLRCIWFAGTAREAMDLATHSGNELKLTMTRGDREEEVWKRLQIGGWTREELRKVCSVSPNLIAFMNKVRRWYRTRSRTKSWIAFRRQYPDLKMSSWFDAKLAFLGATPKERSDEQRMQALARRLRERFNANSHHSLSRNPKITAGALERYDRRLPKALTVAWETEPSAAMTAVRDVEAHADLEDAGLTQEPIPGDYGSAWGALEDPEEDNGNHGAAETPV